MNNHGLSEKTWKDINQVFKQFKEIEEATLYGSRAKGTHKPGSDIDLTLKGQNLSLKVLNKISLALDDRYLPYTFDLSIYHQIDNLDLLSHIQRVGKVIFTKTSE